MNYLDIFNQIYNDVYLKIYTKSTYIFLCGGAGKDNVRNKVRMCLEKKGLRILYPEDLFMELLNRDKQADLLEYENLLAENADIICVLCESFGSAVELGAFCQVDAIREKMIVGIEKRFARDRSFIMMGPVKHIQKERKSAVIEYRTDALEELAKNIVKETRKVKKHQFMVQAPAFSTISFYISFIPLTLFFYYELNRKCLYSTIKKLCTDKEKYPKRYNEIFNAAIKFLINSNVLETRYDTKYSDEKLSLSQKGYDVTVKTLNTSSATEKTILHDQIRCAIMKEQYE